MKRLIFLLAMFTCMVATSMSFAQTPLNVTKPFQGTVVEVPFTIVGTAQPLSQLQVVVNNESIGLFNVDADGNFRIPVSTPAKAFQIEIVRLDNGVRAEAASLSLTSSGSVAPVAAAPVKQPKDPGGIEKRAEPIPQDSAASDFSSDGQPMSRGGRIALEVGVGIGAGLLFSAIAAVLINETNSDEVAWLGATSVVALSAASVWGVGEIAGGNGSYWATLGGTLLGVGAGFGIAILTVAAAFANNNDGLIVGGILVAAAMPVAGAVLGYELSQSDTPEIDNPNPTIKKQPPTKKRRLMWLVAPTLEGGTLQVGATF